MLALLVQIRVFVVDAQRGQAVEDAEFLFAQALINLDRHHVGRAHLFDNDARRFSRPHVRRVQHDVGTGSLRQGGKPAAQCMRLLDP